MSTYPGMRWSAKIYLIADATGEQRVLTIDSPVPLPAPQHDRSALLIIESAGFCHPDEIAAAMGWRFMTDDEISVYRAEEAA